MPKTGDQTLLEETKFIIPSFGLIYISVEPAMKQNCVPLLQTNKQNISYKLKMNICTSQKKVILYTSGLHVMQVFANLF